MTERSAYKKTKAHTAFRPSHTPRWFASTPPIRESNGSDVRQPTSSDFACWIGADNVRAAPKASNAAEHTEHICSRPRLSKRFRHPTVGPVCSCLQTNTENSRISWRPFWDHSYFMQTKSEKKLPKSCCQMPNLEDKIFSFPQQKIWKLKERHALTLLLLRLRAVG